MITINIAAGTKLVVIPSGSHRVAKAGFTADVVAPKVYRTATGTVLTNAKEPSLATLQRYCDTGITRTPCGCKVEPDGTCQHGMPSWLMLVGAI